MALTEGICQACSSRDVVVSTSTTNGGVGPGLSWQVMTDGKGMRGTDQWRTYLCLDCGLFENRLTDRKALDAIRASIGRSNWAPVTGPA